MSTPNDETLEYVPGQVVVTFRRYVAPKTRKNILQELSGVVIECSSDGFTVTLRVPDGSEPAVIRACSAAPGIQSATRKTA